MRRLLTTPKRRSRCEHRLTSELVIAGMRRELCSECGDITLEITEWESEFVFAGDR